jgi:ABC-type sugar transport system ATPase subunit
MLELKNISKIIDDRVILNDISIIFPNTGFIGIKGKSGCGKSSLLYIMSLLDEDFLGSLLFCF